MFTGSINVARSPRDAHQRSEPGGWRERVARWVGRLLLISAFFSLLAIVFADGLIVRAISDVLGLINMPVEPSIFLVCLLFALAGAARRRLRAAHTVVVILMALNVFYSVLIVFAGQLHEGVGRRSGPFHQFGSRPAFGLSEGDYVAVCHGPCVDHRCPGARPGPCQ